MSTPVIFRRTKDAQIVAFFPTIPGDEDMPDSVCAGFTLEEGKCFVDTNLIRSTTGAKYSEYLPLLSPMAEAGYADIKVVQRISQSFTDERLNGGPTIKAVPSVIYDPKRHVEVGQDKNKKKAQLRHTYKSRAA